MPTIKLYDNTPYNTEFAAKIISITPCIKGNNLYELILDRTLFFPESGGQSCDKGTIKIAELAVTVENVFIDKEDNITHIISSDISLEINSLINSDIYGYIDWKHRFSNMQQHSGEHIFSGIVKEKYGFENVGFHLSDNNVTMDYDGYLNPAQVREIEIKVNKYIIQNIDIICSYPNKEELKNIDYRCKTELTGDIRIVEIKGIDICACCCPHVRKTGEIGLLKVISSIRYKGGTRLSILCGFRAFEYFNSLYMQMGELKNLLSSEQSEVVNTVINLKNERDELKFKLREANKNRLITEIDNLAKNSPALIFIDEIDTKSHRESLNYLINKRNGYCGIFVGDEKKGYSYLIGSNNLDSALVQVKLKENLNAKGGGKKEMIQGFVKASRNEIETLLKFI
nr:alanyl-tRNA editing protein [uncultured Catonella sp.]